MLTPLVQFSPALHALVFAATAKKSSGSSTFLFVLLILAVGAFLFIRPQRRRQREQAAMQKAIEPGDEVVMTSGIVGRVKTMNDERVQVEIAPGTTVDVVRRAIGQRVAPSTWDPSKSNDQWDLNSAPGTTAPSDTSTGEDSSEKWGFPSPSPKPDPDEEQTPGEGGEAHS